ncbi:MAG: YdcF family protein [Desulfovibrionaceae bacterium]
MRRVFGRLLQLLGALVLFGGLAAAAGLYFAGQWLQRADVPARSDAIVVLAGDRLRLVTAARLWQDGWAPVILVSLGQDRPPSPLDDIYRRMGYPVFADRQAFDLALLAAAGAPPGVVRFFGGNQVSTVEEAEALRDAPAARGLRSLLVVTSPYHIARARLTLRDILPGDTVLRMTPAQGDRFRTRWWADQYSAQMVVLEVAKLVHYELGGAYRSTDAAPAGNGSAAGFVAAP